jgi:hypothetical protein
VVGRGQDGKEREKLEIGRTGSTSDKNGVGHANEVLEGEGDEREVRKEGKRGSRERDECRDSQLARSCAERRNEYVTRLHVRLSHFSEATGRSCPRLSFFLLFPPLHPLTA